MNNAKLFALAGGAVLGYVVYRAASSGARAAVDAINPASDQNIINKGSNAVIETVSGGRFLSLGDFLFTVLNPNAPGENGRL